MKRDFKFELQIANKCAQDYPSYAAFTNQGIALYRRGRFAEAVKSLEEA